MILLNKDEISIQKKLETMKNKEFLALVVDVNDPKKLGRVKVRISLLHRNITDDKLPWAAPINANPSNGAYGMFYQPTLVGNYVLVKFLDESGFNLTYTNIITSETIPELFKNNYLNTYGIVDKKGNQIYVDTSGNTINIKHQSGSSLVFNNDGSIEINCKNLKINTSDNLNVTANTSNINSSNLEIKTSQTNIDSQNYTNTSNQNTQNMQTGTINTMSNLTINAGVANINSTGVLNLVGGGNVMVHGMALMLNATSAVTVNAAAFIMNAANAVAGVIMLPGVPVPMPVTPVVVPQQMPGQVEQPQALNPLPEPHDPVVANKITY